MMHLKRRVAIPVTAFGAVMAISGCSVQQDIDVVTERKGAGQVHAVELRQIMRELNNVVYEDEQRSALDRDDARRRHALRMADTIDKFVVDIYEAPKKNPNVKLDTLEEKEFYSYAQALKREGQAIREVARSYQLEKLRGAMNDMVAVCNRCHARFRDENR